MAECSEPCVESESRHGALPSPSFGSILEVFVVFLRLGLTSFGGPVAHLGYFRQEIVVRRQWLEEAAYADLVALCQFLPGPASSQVGIALGIRRAGLPGGLAAWLGFTAPSAAALILFAYGVAFYGDLESAGWLRGLKTAAVAVVALAVWGMAGSLCPDCPRAAFAILATIGVLVWPTAWTQLAVIGVAGVIGWFLFRTGEEREQTEQQFHVNRSVAIVCLALFLILLIGLPLLQSFFSVGDYRVFAHVFDSFYRAGSQVFGGGHVVLPLLKELVVPPGWITNAEFIAGYGAAQAVPGPLFTFSAYLGASMEVEGEVEGGLSGWAGGLFALAAIFLPSFLLVIGAVPFWDRLRGWSSFSGTLRGINAAVVGLLLAALYDPVWTSAIHGAEDFALALVALALLAVWKWPPWLVVALSAVAGQGLGFLSQPL